MQALSQLSYTPVSKDGPRRSTKTAIIAAFSDRSQTREHGLPREQLQHGIERRSLGAAAHEHAHGMRELGHLEGVRGERLLDGRRDGRLVPRCRGELVA